MTNNTELFTVNGNTVQLHGRAACDVVAGASYVALKMSKLGNSNDLSYLYCTCGISRVDAHSYLNDMDATHITYTCNNDVGVERLVALARCVSSAEVENKLEEMINGLQTDELTVTTTVSVQSYKSTGKSDPYSHTKTYTLSHKGTK